MTINQKNQIKEEISNLKNVFDNKIFNKVKKESIKIVNSILK